MERLPSPILLISVLAPIVALSGSAYAAVKINGKDIKKGTITAKAIKKNTLGGTQISESKLGKVPSATRADSADSATTAGNASTLGGLTAGAFTQGSGRTYGANADIPASTLDTVLEVPGIVKVRGNCNGSSQLAFSFESLTNNFRLTVTYADTNNIDMTGGGLGSGSSLTLPTYFSGDFSASTWIAGTQTQIKISGGNFGCSATATAVVFE